MERTAPFGIDVDVMFVVGWKGTKPTADTSQLVVNMVLKNMMQPTRDSKVKAKAKGEEKDVGAFEPTNKSRVTNA